MGFFEAIEHWGYLISNSQCLYLYLQMLFNFQSFLCQCIHGCLCTYVSQLSCLSFHHGSQGLNSGNHTIQQVLLSVEYLAAIAQVSVCACVCVWYSYMCVLYIGPISAHSIALSFLFLPLSPSGQFYFVHVIETFIFLYICIKCRDTHTPNETKLKWKNENMQSFLFSVLAHAFLWFFLIQFMHNN